jgi:hypothetical protein
MTGYPVCGPLTQSSWKAFSTAPMYSGGILVPEILLTN